MTNSKSDIEQIADCVCVARDAIAEIRRIIAQSGHPSVYTKIAEDLRMGGVAVIRMEKTLSEMLPPW